MSFFQHSAFKNKIKQLNWFCSINNIFISFGLFIFSQMDSNPNWNVIQKQLINNAISHSITEDMKYLQNSSFHNWYKLILDPNQTQYHSNLNFNLKEILMQIRLNKFHLRFSDKIIVLYSPKNCPFCNHDIIDISHLFQTCSTLEPLRNKYDIEKISQLPPNKIHLAFQDLAIKSVFNIFNFIRDVFGLL